ncbi:hypothetical protein JGH11_10595 [Dysgonomonas sp. Marseille-P4677]|uniref:hypothetical protein n=1 Tax=Dysgonomonas sp. Marseille-P4677 TaxID=2364790 RepID=UPI001912EA43|nr:hypothetical protein [Dysgonomonas sp. Marseille-P4677]MBK5721320.1 hypothetical protein [Dysgonomonas sp. Marseille-P4677]
METNNNEILEQLKVPESITDPDEKEYIEHIYGAIKIAAKKNLPFMILTAYDDMGKAFLSAAGCKHCITKLITELLNKQPDILNVVLEAVAAHMMNKDTKDKQIANYAKKNTPTGN